jgi:hypothetical protein
MVESAGVFLGQSVGVAVYKSALALDSQQTNFLFAIEASFSVDLLLGLFSWLLFLLLFL